LANLALTVVAFASFLAIVTSFATSWLAGTSEVAEGFRVARASDVTTRRSELTERSRCVNPLGTLTSFQVVNGGQAPLRNFADWTLVARYLASTGTTVQTLTYTTSDPPSAGQWTVDEIRMKDGSAEVFSPGVIDPGEEATIAVRFSPGVWASSANSVSLTTDTGSAATIDFTGESACGYYLHNNPSPPTGNTNQQADLTADGTFPGQTTLYNYDQDRDASAGRLIVKGGSGASESDLTKYQNWRTGVLGRDLELSGTVRVHLWAAVKDFNTSATGSVTVYLRDFNGATSTEIASATVTSGPWDTGASGTWVSKTVAIPAVDYTVPAGNRLEVKVIVGSSSGDDMWFAYDTVSYYSYVEVPASVTLNFHSEDRPIADARYNQIQTTSHEAGYYLHNNPTPPTAATNAQAGLTATQVYPSVTTLYNYDQDQDAVAGRRITKGGSGAGEADLPQYQNWQLTAAVADTVIRGTVRLDLWSAVGSFSTSLGGVVTVYLRDYNPSPSGYTEIANATLSATPWDAAASGTWVRRFIEVPNVNYTLARGHQLEVKLIVDSAAGSDMHFAFDTTSYPSVLILPGVAEVNPEGLPVTETVNPGASTGRFRLPTNEGRFAFPLYGYNKITDAVWTVNYRVRRDAYGFKWFTNAYDITPGVEGAWTDIDLSAYVPAGTTGAVVELVNLHSANSYNAMLRGNADTRDYVALYTERIQGRTHRWQMVKVDAGRIIEGYNSSTSNVKFKLLGYTAGNDPVYWDLPPDITPLLPLVWSEVDVAAYVDADATGVILLVDNGATTDLSFGVRETGSTFSATNRDLNSYGNTMYAVGLDANKKFQAYVELTTVKIFLIGQTKGSIGFYVDDLAVADPVLGSWQGIDADTYGVPGTANGLFLYAHNPDNGGREIAFRHGDSVDDWTRKDLWTGGHFQGAIGLNAGNVWDEFMQDSDTNVTIAGYTVGVGLTDADVHADIDILVRKANGEIRATLGTDVANSAIITGPDWVTMSATTTISEYTVVDPTDYLEIDIFAHVTRNDDPASAITYFRIDDSALVPSDRARISGVGLYRD
jgi:hypothetical protein